LLGLAAVALTRGNYPAARDCYERALANAEVAREHDLLRSAHHGLMNCGMASGDLDAAMVHGWNVLRLCIHPDTRAEALLNMAEICRLTGEHEAAFRVFKVAIEWTSVPRVRLHALSGALQTAIVLHQMDAAAVYRREITALMPMIADPYTLTAIGIEFADALYRLGEHAAATDALAQAQSIAVEQSFHELVHRAEQLATLWQTTVHPDAAEGVVVPRATLRRSDHFRTVLRSLNGLTAASL
jgi:tetratricopeptide (TPR) repeat protein